MEVDQTPDSGAAPDYWGNKSTFRKLLGMHLMLSITISGKWHPRISVLSDPQNLPLPPYTGLVESVNFCSARIKPDGVKMQFIKMQKCSLFVSSNNWLCSVSVYPSCHNYMLLDYTGQSFIVERLFEFV